MVRQRFTVFDYVNYAILVAFCFSTFYPFWHVLVISFATPQMYYLDRFHLIPRSFTLEAYQYNFAEPQVFRSFFTSIRVTVSGTSLAMFVTICTGYFLSKREIRGRNLIFFFFVLTMFIQGGIIPRYVLIAQLGMRNTLFALFVPLAINMYFLILAKNYFITMPKSLEESARLDGANDLVVLFRIVVPTSMPIIATLSLFYAVQFWNDWFSPMIYLSDRSKAPLSLYLRGLIATATSAIDQGDYTQHTPATIRAAVIIITMTPIILVYPFLQKYFVKGILVGAIRE